MKKFPLLILLLLSLNSFSQLKKGAALPITDMSSEVSFGHKKVSARKIDIVVLHSTYAVCKDSFDIQAVLNQFKQYGVCAHYIIGRDGEIFRAVAESNIAYHAGVSTLPGTKRGNLNSSSIGIEIINTTTTAPTDAQYESLLYLINDIKKRHTINYVVRHSDIAPGRKTDPWMFNWEVFSKMMGE